MTPAEKELNPATLTPRPKYQGTILLIGFILFSAAGGLIYFFI
jgi:hypothetical protein